MTKTLIQCDFDGTITDEDISFYLLDVFGHDSWRDLFRIYQEGNITVGHFNREAFARVKASRQELLNAVKGRFMLRPGFKELKELCVKKDFRLVIVSNGLDFYIEDFLHREGLDDIEFHAAKTEFNSRGLGVNYFDPAGGSIDKGFKDSYVKLFLNQGYQLAYIGDGSSDFAPASLCQHIFARETLLSRCLQNNVPCTPFSDFNDITRVIGSW